MKTSKTLTNIENFYEKEQKSLIPKTRDAKFIKIKPSYFEHKFK